MINLEKHNSKRANGYSSKGNLPKWLIGNKWYKTDFFGYESLAEYVISHLLINSNIDSFVLYDLVKVLYKNEKTACISKNFLNKDEELVAIEKLHLAEKGIGLSKKLVDYNEIVQKIEYTVDFVESYTKINNFHIYLTKMLELDMFFLNEDRHTNNIAIIRNIVTKKYKIAPIFDNGLSLLYDTNDYILTKDIYKSISKVKSKPFSPNFYLQVEAAETLYGQQLKFDFEKSDIEELTKTASKFYNEDVLIRVKKILYEQMRKYQYLLGE